MSKKGKKGEGNGDVKPGPMIQDEIQTMESVQRGKRMAEVHSDPDKLTQNGVTQTAPKSNKYKKKKGKGGRPSKYTKKNRREILRRLAAGESLRAICVSDHLPDRVTVARWVVVHRKFHAQYARARDVGLDQLADEIIEISDDSSEDLIPGESKRGEAMNVANHARVQRDRLRVDSRKWYVSKLAPKRYGDRLSVTGADDKPLVPGKVQVQFVDAGKLPKGKE